MKILLEKTYHHASLSQPYHNMAAVQHMKKARKRSRRKELWRALTMIYPQGPLPFPVVDYRLLRTMLSGRRPVEATVEKEKNPGRQGR